MIPKEAADRELFNLLSDFYLNPEKSKASEELESTVNKNLAVSELI